MIAFGITILTLLSIGVGYYIFSRNWATNNRLEKRCSRFFKDLKSSGEYLISKAIRKPLFIVETQGRYERFRTAFKKLIIRIKGGEKPHVIYVFGKDTYEEKEAYLIHQIIAKDWNAIIILDKSFTETMIKYFAYKFANEKKDISDSVIHILQKEFEACSFRECVANLDNPEYEDYIVINPPPKKKSLLHDLIIPLVVDHNNKSVKMSFQKKEAVKAELMRIINGICEKKYGILFIGDLSVSKYCDLLRACYNRYDCFLLSARGDKTFVSDNVLESFKGVISLKTRYKLSFYAGTYYFRQSDRRSTNFQYTLVEKKQPERRRR